MYSYLVEWEAMEDDFEEALRLERVELIARLASEGARQEKDREIALHLIAEIAGDTIIKNRQFSVCFSPIVGDKG